MGSRRGCKWTLRRLRRYFQQAGISDWLLWQRITVLVILTVLSHASQVPQTVNCFEFFGFDVLIDNTLRPWLLEVNMGPALGNDCDADRLVKKPMLHDMFDLLGFPLYNTGLSVFNIWTDENQDIAKNKEEFDIKEKTKVSVLNAASKWRKRHRKQSANSRVSSANRRKPRILSATSKNNFPKLHYSAPSPYVINQKSNFGDPLPQSKLYTDECRRSRSCRRWGNGQDWKDAPPREGGWIRIWPLKLDDHDMNTNTNGRGSIKHMVLQVIRFSKLAKDIIKKHPTVSECQLNEFMLEEMEMTTDIWIPPK